MAGQVSVFVYLVVLLVLFTMAARVEWAIVTVWMRALLMTCACASRDDAGADLH